MQHKTHRFQWRYALIAVALVATAAFAQQPDDSTKPAHLIQAEQLVDNLNGATENVYGGGHRHIDWDSKPAAARTVCSSFLTLLLQHTYGWSSDVIQSITGSTNPQADDYHDAIVAHKSFERIIHIDALRPGDILAVKYTDGHISRNGVEDTGHIVIVDEAPVAIDNKKPIVEGAKQYIVTIIDSSASGHGPTDTRAISGGGFTGGIGRGVMRLYANADDDRLIGYTWSNTHKSEYYTSPDRDIVAGRLKLDDLPGAAAH